MVSVPTKDPYLGHAGVLPSSIYGLSGAAVLIVIEVRRRFQCWKGLASNTQRYK